MSYPITILHYASGAVQARGVAVIIDVLRAFTTASFIAAGGARRIMVSKAIDPIVLKQRHPGAFLVGERKGARLPGFDAGNSPLQARSIDWRDRTVILTTSNGTRGLLAVRNAGHVICGSFVNADAIVSCIRGLAPEAVSLVCMGSGGRPALEDSLCADYLKMRLRGASSDFEAMRRRIMAGPAAARFLCSNPEMPAEDLDLCLHLNRFDFVLRAVPDPDGGIRLEKLMLQQRSADR